jgi:nucleotidyltransferase substrate binding protein (TIGR01987 family)
MRLCYYRPVSTLILDPLRDALTQLDAGLRDAARQPNSEIIRDGVIQRFEYSHELAIKFIRRVLETVYGDPVDQMPYNELLRTAAERGLTENVEHWFTYRLARNKTSHGYDAAIATEVFQSATPFLNDAQFLLARLDEIAA